MATSDTSKLKMWTNDTDYVIAESAEEAREIIRSIYGGLDDDEIGELGILADDAFDFQHDNGEIETKTVAEWIAQYGRARASNSI
jgi:hypothetical protein